MYRFTRHTDTDTQTHRHTNTHLFYIYTLLEHLNMCEVGLQLGARHHKHLVPTPLDTTIPLKHPDTARLMVLAMAHLLHPMVPRACRRTGAKRKAGGR